MRLWDESVEDFLGGGSAVPLQVEPWFASYRGSGAGKVDIDALPEPFLGDLAASPRAVILALNPGRAFPFQRRTGAFAQDVRACGSYTEWAAGWPYFDGSWERETGRPNPHHRTRLQFLRRWYDDETLPAAAMVAFELYPWHSTGITATMRPDPLIIQKYVWAPIAELGAPVFAFGAPWFGLLDDGLGLRVVARFGAGGRDYGSAVSSRAVTVFETPSGVRVVAEKHSGSARPPSADETRRLREALSGL